MQQPPLLPSSIHFNCSQVIALKKVPQNPRNDKPVRLPLPHPIYDLDAGTEVCLFVKDHKGAPPAPFCAPGGMREGMGGTRNSHRQLSGGLGASRGERGADLQRQRRRSAESRRPRPRLPELAGEGHKAGKLKVKEERLAGVAKVVGVSKLK